MIEVTTSELKDLIGNKALVKGESYKVTDYDGIEFYSVAVSESELESEYNTEDGEYTLNYDIDSKKVTYMRDNEDYIEAFYDFRDTVTDSKYVYIDSQSGPTITSSNNVHIEGTVIGTISKCNDVSVGDGCTVSLLSCNYITIGENDTVTLSKTDNFEMGDNNTFSSEISVSDLYIGNDNEGITTTGLNIIGSGNRSLIIDGSNNVVECDNIALTIGGDCNNVKDTKYTSVGGSFNTLDKVTMTTLETSVGNELEESDSINLSGTNNNTISTENLAVTNGDALLEYRTIGGVKAVTNKNQTVNYQSDNVATVLDVRNQKLDSDEKGSQTYVIVNGRWTAKN